MTLKKGRLVYFITIFALLFFSCNLYSIDNLGKKRTYLYIEKKEDMKGLDSITYLYNISGGIEESAMDMLVDFSELIGSKNGAFYVPDVYFLNDEITKENYKNDIDYKEILSILSNSVCNFPRDKGKSYLIYENRQENKCHYLDVKNKADLNSLLVDINKIIINGNSNDYRLLVRDIEKKVNDFFNDTEIDDVFENQARRFFDYLLSLLND